MLTLGQQLYSLTLRDQTTSFVDPFLRRNNVTAGAGQALVNIDIPVPIDRSLYIHSIVFDLAKEAATDWESWSINIRRPGNELAGILYQKAANPVLNTRISESVQIQFVAPPGVNVLRFGATRLTTTNAVSVNFEVIGYLIPPGKINRA